MCILPWTHISFNITFLKNLISTWCFFQFGCFSVNFQRNFLFESFSGCQQTLLANRKLYKVFFTTLHYSAGVTLPGRKALRLTLPTNTSKGSTWRTTSASSALDLASSSQTPMTSRMVGLAKRLRRNGQACTSSTLQNTFNRKPPRSCIIACVMSTSKARVIGRIQGLYQL